MKDKEQVKRIIKSMMGKHPHLKDPMKANLLIRSLVDNVWNMAPKVPDDDLPDETDYPDRESLKPTPEDVPDPEDTEGTDETKASTPDYLALKRYTTAIGKLNDSASTLFEMESSSLFDGRFDKNDVRQQTFDWLDEVRSSIYDL